MDNYNTSRPQPTVLIIFDGWGVAPPSHGNAITLAETPYFDYLVKNFPTMTLQASGESVGLPWGEMGNSEVGHLHIGAGKIIFQDLLRINRTIYDGSFFSKEVFLKTADFVKQHNSALHLIGLVSPGGVHAHQEHLYALLEFCKQQKLAQVYIHAILDGRDAPYNSAYGYINDLNKVIQANNTGCLATLMGRFWAMDRDNKWDRIKKAYQAITAGQADYYHNDPLLAIKQSYERKIFDEQLVPTVITRGGKPISQIKDNDAVIFFNFRPDRARQLTRAFVDKNFTHFTRTLLKLRFVTMTEYSADLEVEVAFPPIKIDWPLARVISEAGLTQLHIAETEKYAHVTYFLNGGREKPYANEEHILIPSPPVSSYDQKPYMSAREIRERVLEELASNKYNCIFINFANADMVGHTGNLSATIEGIQVLDECLKEISEKVLATNGVILVTADHGNAEEVLKPQTGEIDKEHTAAPVPFIIIGQQWQKPQIDTSISKDRLYTLTPAGVLADVAPTMLKILGLEKPPAMTGRSLI